MKHLKKLGMLLAVLAVMVFNTLCASAVSMQICYDGATHLYTGEIYKLLVNGNRVTSAMEPIIFNDHALVPVREVFEECGATVGYNGDERSVEVKYNNTYIKMYINDNCAFVNGIPVRIPDNVVPKLIYKPGGLTKTMVPVRFISETVGMNVDFDGDYGVISITESGYKPSAPTAMPIERPTEKPAEAPTPKPTERPTPEPTQKPTDITLLESKMLTDTKIKITATCSDSVRGKISYFDLKNPERVVIDFKGVTFNGKDKLCDTESDIIKEVRTGVDSERTRIVVDVENLDDYTVDINNDTVVITVSVTGEESGKKDNNNEKEQDSDNDRSESTVVPSKYKTGIVAASKADSKKVIMIDAGHGGTDPGALGVLKGKTIKEKDLTLSISRKVRSILESNGYATSMTRTGDTLPSLEERPAQANDEDCALFVSIHINSAAAEEANGTEVYYSDENNDDDYGVTSHELADNVLEGMLKYMKSTDRGVRMANWAVTRRANMPAILLEVGFISNEAELKKMCSDDYQNKVARGIAEGIINTVHYVEIPD